MAGPGAGDLARGFAELPAITCACPQLVRIHIVLVRVSRSVLQQQQQSKEGLGLDLLLLHLQPWPQVLSTIPRAT